MDGRKLMGIGVFVVILAVVMYTRFNNRTEASDETYEAIMTAVRELPCYQVHPDTMEETCQRAHQMAFDQAYDIGGRYRAARFDDMAYVKGFFSNIIREVEYRNDKDAIQQLRDCQIRCEQIVEAYQE
jgi:hypothetical protein